MRKQRDKLINEIDEKRELQAQYNKLDEAYKDQAQEISNFKHRISELSMGIEEKQENIAKNQDS
jgi:predicted nuclease with TOPRIM domain